MRFAICFLFACIGFWMFAQRLELKTLDPVLYFNDENGQLTVIDDTNWVRTYSVRGTLLSSQKVIKKALTIQELKQEFIPVMHHKKLHFVERGCGRVYRFNQGKLERIDHSFSHRNQYDALFISYKDTIYCIGGYGFFTAKDHVTYFDEGLGQWFLKNRSPQIRHHIIKPMYQIYGESLMVFGSEIGELSNNLGKSRESLMEFSFKTCEWRKVGALKMEVAQMSKNARFQSKNTSVGSQYVILFSPGENKVHVFSQDKTIRQIYGFNEFLVVNKLVMTSYKMYSHVIEFHGKNEYLKSRGARVFRFREKVAPHQSFSIKFWIVLIVVFVTAGLFIVKRKWFSKQRERILPEEIDELLAIWIGADNNSIELSDLNHLVAYDNPEAETLKKRRESLLKRLRSYLIECYNFEEDEVYITELSPRDKRIKLFILHPKVVKWYNKVK